MEIQKAFAVLKIEETKDEAQIRSAYRSKLTAVNPEDNPEGFKQLREAYEAALAYAGQPEEGTEEEAPDDPVSQLLKKADEVYRDLFRRLNEKEWEEIVKDGLFDDLELGESAQWRLFSYLAEHYRMPAKIWRILDRAFGIAANEEEFKEHLNRNFVDFMVWKVSADADNTDFTFEKLKGDPKADYDSFLNGYEELVRLLNQEDEVQDREEWVKTLSQKAAFLDGMGIFHPWYGMERAKVLFFAGQEEEAERIARSLLEENRTDSRIVLASARMLDRRGLFEEAAPLYRELLDFEGLTDDQAYMASLRLGEIGAEKQDWEEARSYALRSLRLYNTQAANDLLEKVNTALIGQYTRERADELTAEEGERLAWCYIQTGRAKEGWIFFAEHPVLGDDIADCRWARAVMALESGLGEEAAREAKGWRSCLLAQEEAKRDRPEAAEQPGEGAMAERPDGEAAEQPKESAAAESELPYRLAQSYELEGKAYQLLYRQQADPESEAAGQLKKAALEAFDEAISRQDGDVNFLTAKVLFLRELKEYEQTAALCERIKKIDSQYYWAYFYAQEAYEGLRRAQEVVDNFYDAKKIYAGHAEIYERALRVFLAYNQPGDAQHVVEQADEAGVSSPYLMVKKLALMRRFVEEEERQKEIDEYAAEVIARLEELGGQDSLLAEAYMQRAYHNDDHNRMDFFARENLEKWTLRAIALNDTVNARYFLGRYYLEYKDDGQKAYEHLKICEERGMDFVWMYYYLARSHEDFGRWDDAIEYYKKGMEKEPKDRDFAWRIAWLYRRKFARTGQIEYAREALHYLDVQKEIAGISATSYWQYSDLHARLGEYEKALEEIEEALKKDSQSRNWGHKGLLLEQLGRGDEAPECYERGIAADLKKGEDYAYGYSRMYDYFLDRKDYESGILWLKQAMKQAVTKKTQEDITKYIRNLYRYLKRWNKALGMVEQRYGSAGLSEYCCESWEKEGQRIQEILDIYKEFLPDEELLEKNRLAEKLYRGEGNGRKPEEHAYGRWYACIGIAYSYEDYLLDDEAALIWMKEAEEQLGKTGKDAAKSDLKDTYYNLMECYCRLGDPEQARHYGKLYLDVIAGSYEECRALGREFEELHAGACGNERRNLYQLFHASYYCGEYEKARQIVARMEGSRWCWNCSRKECTELWECRAFLALIDGDVQKAWQCFERSIACAPWVDDTGERELRRLKRAGFAAEQDGGDLGDVPDTVSIS